MKKFCPSCGFDLDVKADFEPKHCSHCGLKLSSKVDFCPKCGKRPVERYAPIKTALITVWLVIATLCTLAFIGSLFAAYFMR